MVQQPAPVSGGLEALPARPPTPPRETQHRLLQQSRPLHPLLNLQTPPSHSPTISDAGLSTSQRLRKKVGFSGEAQYQEAPVYSDRKHVKTAKQPTPSSVHSSAASAKPLKSILKPSPGPNPLDPSACQDLDGSDVNLAAMLESTIKQLAGADRDSKVDAYMMLVRALKVSNNLPDRIALQDKMSLFTQFIQRDITTGNNGELDPSLVNHALTLLVTFQYFPAIASTLSNDFGIFILDHCIRSFQDASVPKDIIRHLMQVVASQDFSPKVLTADRVGRIVASLHNIENHQKGKSIIMSRIIIYRKLVKQARLSMLTHSDWLLDLFTDMLSSLKEIRATAIALGFDVHLALGKEKQLFKRVVEMFKVEVEDTKYIEYYIEKLRLMVKERAESVVVPQIWSVVVLLLRSPIDRWEYFIPWLDIIQKCFNNSDWQTKHEANLAWNRLVYALQKNEASFSKVLGTLCQPFSSQLKRRITSAKQEELRRTILGSICNLWYYAFKPNTKDTQMDTLWKVCIVPIMEKLTLPEHEWKFDQKSEQKPEQKTEPKPIEKSDRHWIISMSQAAQLFAGLLDSTTPRIWKEDRVFDKPLPKSDELPALDAKWIRRNAALIFEATGPIFEFKFLELASSDSDLFKLWRTIINSVVTASSKEVKVSIDTALFIGNALRFALSICSQTELMETNEGQQFAKALEQYFLVMISSLGLLPFTEKQLSMGRENSFIPIATPSHHDGKGQGPAKSSLFHLFWILATQLPGTLDVENSHNLVKAVLTPFFVSRSTQGRRDLAVDLMQSLPLDSHCSAACWQFVSEVLSSTLEDSQASVTSSSGPTVGHEFRGIVRHLERGLLTTSDLPWEAWHSLFVCLVDRAVAESGAAGCAIAAIEPLAKVTLEAIGAEDGRTSGLAVHVGCELVSRSNQPKDRQALDAARRRLWGTMAAGPRSSTFDPFDNLYRMINHLLSRAYTQVNNGASDASTLLSETTKFLSRANLELTSNTITALQPSISCWIKDADGHYNSGEPLFESVMSLWDRVCSILGNAEGLARLPLSSIEPLLCAAFDSKHRIIVQSMTSVWNMTFEHTQTVELPETLRALLIAIRPYVDIALPGIASQNQEASDQQPRFLDSQDLSNNTDAEIIDSLPSPVKSIARMQDLEKVSSSRASSPLDLVKLSFPVGRSNESTPTRRTLRTRTKKKGGKAAKLRHDDSQIHFAPIESSSPNHDAESQRLTERQKEVRERQRDASALFSELRSNASDVVPEVAVEPQLPELPVGDANPKQASTPKANPSLDQYVASTPTPRRGQAALMIQEQYELDEVPSSPPEPRRNLLPEMRTRSRSSSSIMDDFQFSSSPVSGSPTADRQANDKDHETTKDQDVNLPDTNPVSENVGEELPVPAPRNEAAVQVAVDDRLRTPPNRRRTRSRVDSPKSDDNNEVFVDALSSPQGKSPRLTRSSSARLSKTATEVIVPSASRSFELSEGEENSMARLIVELDSRKCAPAPKHDGASPDKVDCTPNSAIECIEVLGESGSEANTPLANRLGSIQSLSAIIPSTPVDIESPHTSIRRSKRKRKRTHEVADSTQKKRRPRSSGRSVDLDAVPASQIYTESPHHDASSSAFASDGSFDRDGSEELGMPTSSSPVPFLLGALADSGLAVIDSAGADSSDMSETEAINSQLLADSQGSFSGRQGGRTLSPSHEDELIPVKQAHDTIGGEVAENDVDMGEGAMTPTPLAKSAGASIMESLRAGLRALQTAQLNREEVYEIEDMFMDIKKELYAAEERSRSRQ